MPPKNGQTSPNGSGQDQPSQPGPSQPNTGNESTAPARPGRLESLSVPGKPGARGRFAPNAVGRRSKTDRDSTAPAIKPEKAQPSSQKQNDSRDRRKGRFSARVEASGPLSAPSTVDPRRMGRASGPSGASSGGGGGGGRKYGVKHDPEAVSKYASEDGRIDIADPSHDQAYFPLRVHQHIPSTEDNNESIPTQSALEPDQLYLLQLPSLDLEPKQPVENPDEMKDDEPVELEYPSGQIGTLQYHASGKISMLIGDVVFDVTPGVKSTSVEELVLVDDENVKQLGTIQQRLVVVPDVSNFA